MITPSDFVYAIIIKHAIFYNRSGTGAENVESFPLLVFLSDSILCCKGLQFDSLSSLLRSFKNYVDDESLSNHILQFLFNLTSADAFFNEVHSMKELFENGYNINQNELKGPSTLSRDSYLGLYMRTFLVKCHAMSFEETCDFLEAIHGFLGESTDSKVHAVVNTSSGSSRSLSVFAAASLALSHRDVKTSEILIHHTFDQSSGSRLQNQLHSSSTLDNAVSELAKHHNQETGSPFSARLASSMISLASMWILSHNYSLAASAVEEALKSAHQRKDHQSVAKALLLLFHIFDETQGSLYSGSKAEAMLMSCLHRCWTLNLRASMCDVALLLINLRSRCSLSSASAAVGGNPVASPFSVDVTIAKQQHLEDELLYVPSDISILWLQLSSALLGKTSLLQSVLPSTVQATDLKDIVASSMSSASTPALGSTAAAAMLGAARKPDRTAQLREAIWTVSPTHIKFCVNAALTAISLWERHDMLLMASFACQRAIRQYAAFSSLEDIVKIMAKFVRVRTNIAVSTAFGPFYLFPAAIHSWEEKKVQRRRALKTLKCLTDLSDYLLTLYSNNTTGTDQGHAVKETIHSSKLYVAIYACVCNRQWCKAERLAARLLELNSRSGVQTVESPVAAAALTTVLPISAARSVTSSVTDSSLEARVILASLHAAQGSYDLCDSILMDCEQAALRVDLVRWRIQCAVMRCVNVCVTHNECCWPRQTCKGRAGIADGIMGYCLPVVSAFATLSSLRHQARLLNMMKVEALIVDVLDVPHHEKKA